MSPYGKAAVMAVKICRHNATSDPVAAWSVAVQDCLEHFK